MYNPYFTYLLSFTLAFLTYNLKWSYLFPDLKVETWIFFVFTFLISIAMGIVFVKKKMDTFYKIEYRKNYRVYTFLILIGYGIEFMYSRSIPLLNLFVGDNSVIYMTFGIPVFHVFLVTFNSFLAIYLFHVLLSTGLKKYVLIPFLILVSTPLLIVNRAMFLMILTSCFIIYFCKKRRVRFRTLLFGMLIIMLVLYSFGILGNLRVNNSYSREPDPFDNTVIFQVGGVSSNFLNSLIPEPYFWSYIYLASPLANFQQTVDNSNVSTSLENLFIYATNNWFPDFISKRINTLEDWHVPKIYQISPELNVGTIYGEAFTQFGWLGCLLMFVVLSLTAFIYLISLRNAKSDFYLTGLAIFCTIFLFSSFSNMFTFSGLSFQLIYPILFTITERLKSRKTSKKIVTSDL
ncbi:oligosaccharide repeat unit polymerase [Sporolactobacillus sp. THM7-7]|nr:oligosaccharide repeat unit polymerase [Sporolactobacillus sp. THM7-7]